MWKSSKLPIILQAEVAECGLACLAMIVRYYGWKVTLSELRHTMKSSLKGVTLSQLKNMAEKVGLLVKVMYVDQKQVTSVQLPCIIHWNSNHFVVVRKMAINCVVVHDPARGVRSIPKKQFEQEFSGIVLEVAPSNTFRVGEPSRKKSAAMLQDLLKTYRFSLLKLVLFSSAIQLFYVGAVKMTQKCIDVSVHMLHNNLLYGFILAFSGLKFMEVSAIAIRAWMISSLGSLINNEFGVAVMKHLLFLPVSFFENRHAGSVISRFAVVEKMRSVVTEGLVEGVVDGFVSILMLLAICLTYFNFIFIIAGTAFIYAVLRLFYNARANQYHDEVLYARSIELSNLLETVRAMAAIKIFNKELDRIEKWSLQFVKSIHSMTRLFRQKIIFDSMKNALFAIDFMVTLSLGCLYLSERKITLGILYALLAYRQQFITSIASFADKVQEYKSLQLHLERLDDVVSEPKETQGNTRSFFEAENISLENIMYVYPLDILPTLKQMNLEIRSKECIVITGPSGCGKTTLLKIMMGLLPPTAGNVYLDSIPIYPNYVVSYRKKNCWRVTGRYLAFRIALGKYQFFCFYG